jgi:hypothetical protein
MFGCKYQRTMLGGMELHIVEPLEALAAPVVFILHSFTARAFWMFGFCRDLANKGFRASVYPEIGHRFYPPMWNEAQDWLVKWLLK